MLLKIMTNKGRSGFTLVELLITIAILGILSAIAIPLLLGQRTKAMVLEAENNLNAIFTANENYYADNGRYAPWPDEDDDFSVGTMKYEDATTPLEDQLIGLKFSEDRAFDYRVTSSDEGQQFQAYATGKSGTRVAGTEFKLNEQNKSDF